MTTLQIQNPATGELIKSITIDSAASIASKATNARAAQKQWAKVPLADRIACIAKFKQGVLDQLPSLALTMTLETGKPIAMSRNELNGLIARLDFFMAQAASAIATEEVFNDGSMCEQIEHVALGVVANISAWNYPWFVGCNVIIPALLTGNAVLYKPSEFASLTGLEIVSLLHKSGIPQNLVASVIGGKEAGQTLLAQQLDGLFFTGSHATGVAIAKALAPALVKVQLELGGKDPTYVCEDVDIANAAASLADGAMYNTGQSCCSVERIYVHESIYDQFVDAFVETVKAMKLGDPQADDTYLGAMTRPAQIQVLEAQVADAVSKGAVLHCGGKRATSGASMQGAAKSSGTEEPSVGNWFEASVLSNVNHSMELMRDESFGPIIGIQKVSSDEQAIALMNDTRYGLTAGVYSSNQSRAKAILSQVNAGSTYWNCCDRVSPRLPWSGFGDSGIGLTLSRYGIQTFTRPKAWHLKTL